MENGAGPARFCIVTPVLNYAGFIDQTIMSVLTQSGDFTLAYHVQDGGSTDGTVERLQAWSDRLSAGFPAGCRDISFTWSSGPDGGLYDAINRGFAALPGADGDWLSWINASDLLWPGALQTAVRLDRRLPEAGWLCGRRAHMDEDGFLFFLDDELAAYPRATLAAGLHVGRSLTWIQPEGMLWRRWLWRAAGGIDARFRVAGDWDLWRRFAAHAGPVAADRVTGVFRFHRGRLSEDMDRYYAEVDATLEREGLTARGRALEEELLAHLERGDLDGLHRRGLSGLAALWPDGEADGDWRLVRKLPGIMPDWPALTGRLGR